MDGDANALYRERQGHFTDVRIRRAAWGGRAPRDAANARPALCRGRRRRRPFRSLHGELWTNGLFLNPAAESSKTCRRLGRGRRRGGMTPARSATRQRRRVGSLRERYVTGGKELIPISCFATLAYGSRDVTARHIKALEADHGALWADVDGDGRRDLALTGSQATGMHLIMRNLLAAADRTTIPADTRRGRPRRATRAGAEVRGVCGRHERLISARLVDSGPVRRAERVLPVHVGVAGERESTSRSPCRAQAGRPVTRQARHRCAGRSRPGCEDAIGESARIRRRSDRNLRAAGAIAANRAGRQELGAEPRLPTDTEATGLRTARCRTAARRRHSGPSGRSVRGSFMIAINSSPGVRPAKGRRPVTRLAAITPRANTSLRSSMARPSTAPGPCSPRSR